MTIITRPDDVLTSAPEKFRDWFYQKVSVQDLAMLAARCHETGAPVSHGLSRAISLLLESWRVVKGESVPIAKQDAGT